MKTIFLKNKVVWVGLLALFMAVQAGSTVLFREDFESTPVGSTPSGWSGDMARQKDVLFAVSTSKFIQGKKSASLSSKRLDSYVNIYHLLNISASTVMVSYWQFFSDTNYPGDNYQTLLKTTNGQACFAQKIDSGMLMTAGNPLNDGWGDQKVKPIPGIWHQCKWVIYKNSNTADFYWDDMSKPVSRGNKPYIGGDFKGPYLYYELINFTTTPWHIDDIVITDLDVPSGGLKK